MNIIMRNFTIAFSMLKAPSETLAKIVSEGTLNALAFLLIVGATTALLTPVQVYLGFEEINGLHAGGQAEFLARDISIMFNLGIEYRPILIEVFYIFILLFSTGILHIILKAAGGKGSIRDTLKMIAYGMLLDCFSAGYHILLLYRLFGRQPSSYLSAPQCCIKYLGLKLASYLAC
ncbi:MAG: hypothetical protein QXR06_02410 [Candidatus Bathyarchaeia archaeon]